MLIKLNLLIFLIFFSFTNPVAADPCKLEKLCDFPLPEEAIRAKTDSKEPLGSGTFGTVYLIPKMLENKKYVSKYFKKNDYYFKEIEEIKSLKSLLDVKTVNYFPEFYKVDKNDSKIVVKSYISGEPLYTYLMGNNPKHYLDQDKFFKLKDLLESLSQFKNYVIHDLHPNNLIYNKPNGWVVIDFKIKPKEKNGEFWKLIWAETSLWFANKNTGDGSGIQSYIEFLNEQNNKFKDKAK